jgi:hypothetical protein
VGESSGGGAVVEVGVGTGVSVGMEVPVGGGVFVNTGASVAIGADIVVEVVGIAATDSIVDDVGSGVGSNSVRATTTAQTLKTRIVIPNTATLAPFARCC